jgi:hypothetical protein
MWLDSHLQLPRYVTIASAGRSVIAFGHIEDFGRVLDWCARAMKQFDHADQVSIGRPRSSPSGALPVSLVIPDVGWVRSVVGWKRARGSDLCQFFDGLPEGPRTLLTNVPLAQDGDCCHSELFADGQACTGLLERLPADAPIPLELRSILDAIGSELREERQQKRVQTRVHARAARKSSGST